MARRPFTGEGAVFGVSDQCRRVRLSQEISATRVFRKKLADGSQPDGGLAAEDFRRQMHAPGKRCVCGRSGARGRFEKTGL